MIVGFLMDSNIENQNENHLYINFKLIYIIKKNHVSFLIQQIQHPQWFQTNFHVAQQHILDFMIGLKNNYCFFQLCLNYLVTKTTM
jgi:hypothetical protein